MSTAAAGSTTITSSDLNPEQKFILGEFSRLQCERHGMDWQQAIAGEAGYAAPFLQALAAIDPADAERLASAR